MRRRETTTDLNFEIGRLLAWIHRKAEAVRSRQEAAAKGLQAKDAAARSTSGESERNRSIAR